MKKLLVDQIMVMLALVGLLLAACGEAAVEPTVTVPAVSDEETSEVIQGSATLVELNGSGVSGEATLLWDPDTQVLTAALELEGLEQGVNYVSMIAPSCDLHSGFVHMLGQVKGSEGTSHATLELADVGSVDLGGGWAVKLARPPAGEQACGEVVEG